MLLLLLLHLKDDTKTCITLDNIESLLRFIVFMFVFSFHIYSELNVKKEEEEEKEMS